MIFCESCKAIFDEDDLVVKKLKLDDDAYGIGPSEYEEGFCPYCDSYELDCEYEVDLDDYDEEDYDEEDEDTDEEEEE